MVGRTSGKKDIEPGKEQKDPPNGNAVHSTSEQAGTAEIPPWRVVFKCSGRTQNEMPSIEFYSLVEVVRVTRLKLSGLHFEAVETLSRKPLAHAAVAHLERTLGRARLLTFASAQTSGVNAMDRFTQCLRRSGEHG